MANFRYTAFQEDCKFRLRHLKLEEMKTRLKILHQTIDLINEKGPTALRIEDLSQALQLSPGNITYYFPKKGAILEGVAQLCTDEILAVTEGVNWKSMSLDSLFRYYQKICKIQWDYRGSQLYQMAQIHSTKAGRKADREGLEYFYNKFNEVVQEMKKSGLIQTIAPEELLRLRDQNFLVMTTWMIQYIPYESKSKLKATLNYYSYVGIKCFQPYLTELGASQLKSIADKHGKRPF